MNEAPQAIIHVVVRGRVQGVGYRAFVEDEALRRHIAGWVRNRRDGMVEAVFAGEAETVEAMIASCRIGPHGARVEGIEEREARAEERPAGMTFTVLPTV